MTFSKRYLLFIFLVVLGFLLIIGRLVYLMVWQHDNYLKRSDKQIQKLIKVDASRGKILDRNNHPLALSLPVYSIYASPIRIKNKVEFAKAHAALLKMDEAELFKKINNSSTFVWLRRKVTDVDVAALKRIHPLQLNALKEERRVYPNHGLLGDVLGFVGMDSGLGGLEYQFDRFLTGEQGYYIIQGDPRGVRIISSDKVLVGKAKGFSKGVSGVEATSLRGGNLVTTIDYRVQFLVESALKKTVDRVKAKGGQAVVMDVKTGDIIAMADYPSFNPNQYQDVPHSQLKNSCLVDVFEPGSIFKIITYAAALEEGIVTPGTIIEIPESITIQKRQIREAHPRKIGEPTHYSAEDIVVKSMNVGTSILAERMGKLAFFDAVQSFGFGEKTQLLLPGEAKGLLRSVDAATPIDLAVMSFGHGIGVTSLQMVAAAAAIGNDGMYVRPRIIKHQTDHHHLTLSNPYIPKQRRVVSSQTAKRVREAMAENAKRGTGQYAQIKSYNVGGKTGTAQKPLLDGRGYEEGAYVATFVGLLPIESPQFAVLVVVDHPTTTIWGSTAAAPLFSDIAQVLVDYFDIPPDETTGSL